MCDGGSMMKFEKKILTELVRCYDTSSTVVDGERKILLATEGEGCCYSYSGQDFEQSTVWGGKLRGVPSIIGGDRRVEKELFVIQLEG
jgi:hypothetical protein